MDAGTATVPAPKQSPTASAAHAPAQRSGGILHMLRPDHSAHSLLRILNIQKDGETGKGERQSRRGLRSNKRGGISIGHIIGGGLFDLGSGDYLYHAILAGIPKGTDLDGALLVFGLGLFMLYLGIFE